MLWLALMVIASSHAVVQDTSFADDAGNKIGANHNLIIYDLTVCTMAEAVLRYMMLHIVFIPAVLVDGCLRLLS